MRREVHIIMGDHVKVGNHVSIMYNFVRMSRGGVVIEDDVSIAANTQILTNNHDEHQHRILLCKPVVIKKNAWIGAASVVTRDVPANTIVVGNLARVLREVTVEHE